MKRIIAFVVCFSLLTVIKAQNVPDFTATDVDGKTHTLYAYLEQRKYVLLDFTASW